MSDKEEKKGGKNKKKDEKPEQDVIKPTRAISAYIYFSNDIVPKLKAKEGLSHKDAMGRAGKLWGEMSQKEKEPYEKMNKDDVAR